LHDSPSNVAGNAVDLVIAMMIYRNERAKEAAILKRGKKLILKGNFLGRDRLKGKSASAIRHI